MSGRRPRRSAGHTGTHQQREEDPHAPSVRPYAATATLVLLAVMVAYAVVVHSTAGFKPLPRDGFLRRKE
jgi:hypothetical protein